MRRIARLGLVVLATILVTAACGDGGGGTSEQPGVDAARGAQLFEANCAVCHGAEGRGTTAGPPLLHEYYVPSHHGDESFQVAVARGVQPHHWDFGAMPPVPGLTRDDVADIVAHVRQLQREAGIID